MMKKNMVVSWVLVINCQNHFVMLIYFQNDPSWLDLRPGNAKEIAKLSTSMAEEIGDVLMCITSPNMSALLFTKCCCLLFLLVV